MCREQLLGAYSEGEALAIYQQVQATGDFVGFAQQFMHDADYQVARNALWGLTKATDAELATLRPILPEIIDLVMTTANPSVRRLALNMVERQQLTEDDIRADFYDFCLAHMLDVEEYPGIQSLCMKLAHRMAAFYPELTEELLRIIRSMHIDYYKPALKSVRSRILAGKKV